MPSIKDEQRSFFLLTGLVFVAAGSRVFARHDRSAHEKAARRRLSVFLCWQRTRTNGAFLIGWGQS
jgi:hypothetical protein